MISLSAKNIAYETVTRKLQQTCAVVYSHDQRLSGVQHNYCSEKLCNRYQRIVLNVQTSSWADVKAGVSQGSILGPLLFLIYINDLSENLKSTVKRFADDTSIFPVVKKSQYIAEILNYGLTKISEWV